jgi:hypothetical protein
MIICLIGEAFRGIAAGRHALMFTNDWGLGICTYMSDTDESTLAKPIQQFIPGRCPPIQN